ncbi:MAG: hypothetical protein ACKOFW_07890 [Planctomycetaceae bacterium]
MVHEDFQKNAYVEHAGLLFPLRLASHGCRLNIVIAKRWSQLRLFAILRSAERV